ncbi:MAG: amidase family protein [Ilumatobacteraceae bacterium]
MEPTIDCFSTATDMLAALASKAVSSVELTQEHIDRIERLDRTLNAIAIRTPERALEAARRADAARGRGDNAGALLGLPMTVKESTMVAGLPQSAGIPSLAGHVPTTDGPIARSLFSAGVGLLGKTNIPVALSDWQADSPVYGRTVNPWDHSRTPGGSTGGGAAALAVGLTPLEIGSDIGGSIRVPAAYCGVYGHRPSETAVPRAGAFPFADAPNPAAVMGVQGPMARCAADLELLFDVIAGPEDGESTGFREQLPAARHDRLADFRVAVMPDQLLATVSNEVQQRLDELVDMLARTGATVVEAMPAIDAESHLHDYLTLLAVRTSGGVDRATREAQAKAIADSGDPMAIAQAAGLVLDANDFMALLSRRESARAAWHTFFADWDVLVAPVALDVAFPHATEMQGTRMLVVDGVEVPYSRNIVHSHWAIFAGQPATAFPAGLNAAGLPIGLQALGPYLEDRTTLRFARLLEREWHRYQRPPGV